MDNIIFIIFVIIFIFILYGLWNLIVILLFSKSLSNSIISRGFYNEDGNVKLTCPLGKLIHIYESNFLCYSQIKGEIYQYQCDPSCSQNLQLNPDFVTNAYDELKSCNGKSLCNINITIPHTLGDKLCKCDNPIIIGTYDCYPEKYNGPKLKENILTKCITNNK